MFPTLRTLFCASLLAPLLAIAAPAQAGRSCEARQPDTTAVVRGLNLAERTAYWGKVAANTAFERQ